MGARKPAVPHEVDSVMETTPLLAFLSMLRDLPDGDTVAYAISRGMLGSLNSSWSLIYSARSDRLTADLVGAYGIGARESRIYSTVTADMHLPGPEVFRTGVERFLPAESVAREYPLAAPFFEALPPQGDIGFIPMMHRGAPIGFLIIGFPATLNRTWPVRSMIDAVTDATALWVMADALRNEDGRALASPSPPLELTVRQRTILGALREGQSVRQIAGDLGYSQATIKADITALGKLLGARGRADILAKAKQAGI